MPCKQKAPYRILVRGALNLHKLLRNQEQKRGVKAPYAPHANARSKTSYNRYSTIIIRFVALCAPALTVYCRAPPVAASSEDLTVMWL